MSTSATCAARPRRAASRGLSRRFAASATRYARREMRRVLAGVRTWFQGLSFRARLTLAAAGAVAVVVVVASAVAYVLVKDQLRGEVDASLRERVHEILDRPGPIPIHHFFDQL